MSSCPYQITDFHYECIFYFTDLIRKREKRQKRATANDELCEDFDYEINPDPDDQQFEEKIAQKEKEMANAIKAEKS